MTLRDFLSCIILSALLASCGGGGGSNTSSTDSVASSSSGSSSSSSSGSSSGFSSSSGSSSGTDLITQTFNFEESGPIFLNPGDTYINAARGDGSGDISYQSSDELVATINSNAEVVALAEGTTIISAQIEQDDTYSSATANYDLNVEFKEQTLAFTDPGPITAYIGMIIENVAEGVGDGNITYSTSDGTIAQVTDDGNVRILSAGRVTILARIESDGIYREGSASYAITAEEVKQLTMSAWIGEERSNVNLAPLIHDAELFRSNELNCDIDNYLTCENGQVDTLSIDSIFDTAATLNRTAYYDLRIDGRVAPITVSTTHFPESLDLQAVRHEGKTWLIGSGTQSEVWSSFDGENWDLVTDSAAFPSRRNHQLASFKGKLWLIGGLRDQGSSNYYSNDIWSSTDGVNWVQEVTDAPFPERTSHQLLVHNDRLWIIAGAYLNDVWSSQDGTTWTLETENTGFPSRYNHKSISHDEKLWVVGGKDENGEPLNDVWSSDDGITWNLVTGSADFSPREDHQMVSYSGKMLLIGGGSNGRGPSPHDIWSSTDGESWELELSTPQFSAGIGHQIVSHNNLLWLIGGAPAGMRSTEVWRSADGVNWEEITQPTRVFPIYSHQVICHNKQLWAFGGRGGNPGLMASNDGITWKWPTWISADYPPHQFDHQMISFNGKIWLIGGQSGSIGGSNAIWTYTDEEGWVEVTANGAFEPRYGHRILKHDGLLWLVGGIGSRWFADVWSSSDGVSWDLVTDNAPFSFRKDHQLVSHNGKIWLIGGQSLSDYKHDIWSSVDGINWSLESDSSNTFSERSLHQAVSFNNNIWIIGGSFRRTSKGFLNDIWRSEDGINWQEVIQEDLFTPREAHQVTSCNSRLFLTGGIGKDIELPGDIWSSSNGLDWRRAFRDIFEFN